MDGPPHFDDCNNGYGRCDSRPPSLLDLNCDAPPSNQGDCWQGRGGPMNPGGNWRNPQFNDGPRAPMNFDNGHRGPRNFNNGPRGPMDFNNGPRGPVDFNNGPRGPMDFNGCPGGPMNFNNGARGSMDFCGPRGPRNFNGGPGGNMNFNNGPRGSPGPFDNCRSPPMNRGDDWMGPPRNFDRGFDGQPMNRSGGTSPMNTGGGDGRMGPPRNFGGGCSSPPMIHGDGWERGPQMNVGNDMGSPGNFDGCGTPPMNRGDSWRLPQINRENDFGGPFGNHDGGWRNDQMNFNNDMGGPPGNLDGLGTSSMHRGDGWRTPSNRGDDFGGRGRGSRRGARGGSSGPPRTSFPKKREATPEKRSAKKSSSDVAKSKAVSPQKSIPPASGSDNSKTVPPEKSKMDGAKYKEKKSLQGEPNLMQGKKRKVGEEEGNQRSCKEDGTRGGKRQTLENQKPVESGAEKFCKLCDVRYAGSSTDHQRSNQHQTNLVQSNPVCNECSQVFDSASNYRKHCTLVHQKNIPLTVPKKEPVPLNEEANADEEEFDQEIDESFFVDKGADDKISASGVELENDNDSVCGSIGAALQILKHPKKDTPEFIVPAFYCNLCCTFLHDDDNVIEFHCKSRKHRMNVGDLS